MDNSLCVVRCLEIYLCTARSKILTAGAAAIGLKLLGSDKEPDLCNGVTTADFQAVGKIEIWSD